MDQEQILQIIMALTLFAVVSIYSYLYVKGVRARKEKVFKSRVLLLSWGAGTVLIVLPGFLYIQNITSAPFFWIPVYLCLFSALPFFYRVEEKRADLRWEQYNVKDETWWQLQLSLSLFALGLASSVPLVLYNHHYLNLSDWVAIPLLLVMIGFFYFGNRKRISYIEDRYGQKVEMPDQTGEEEENEDHAGDGNT